LPIARVQEEEEEAGIFILRKKAGFI